MRRTQIDVPFDKGYADTLLHDQILGLEKGYPRDLIRGFKNLNMSKFGHFYLAGCDRVIANIRVLNRFKGFAFGMIPESPALRFC